MRGPRAAKSDVVLLVEEVGFATVNPVELSPEVISPGGVGVGTEVTYQYKQGTEPWARSPPTFGEGSWSTPKRHPYRPARKACYRELSQELGASAESPR